MHGHVPHLERRIGTLLDLGLHPDLLLATCFRWRASGASMPPSRGRSPQVLSRETAPDQSLPAPPMWRSVCLKYAAISPLTSPALRSSVSRGARTDWALGSSADDEVEPL